MYSRDWMCPLLQLCFTADKLHSNYFKSILYNLMGEDTDSNDVEFPYLELTCEF